MPCRQKSAKLMPSAVELAPRGRERPRAMRLSGLEPFALTEDSLFVNVGERTNITGSARFRNLIKDGDYDTALTVDLIGDATFVIERAAA